MNSSRVLAAFRDQARACRDLGSPFTAGLCECLADALADSDSDVTHAVCGWPGDPTPSADSVPLRLVGALHALVLQGTDPRLDRMYRTRQIEPATVLAAISRHGTFILDWLASPPQTNEVARSAAIIAAARFLFQQTGLPIHALELGASAGLNLNFAHYGLLGDPPGARLQLMPEWRGELPEAAFRVSAARGVDLKPVDPIRDRLRLMAYCWADQDARLERLGRALDIAETSPPRLEAADAGEWLQHRLAHMPPGETTLVYHTIAAQYFPATTRHACEMAMARAGAQASPDRALAHFAMEQDGLGAGAGLTLRLWDGGLREWRLGRADFHGRWIDWAPEYSKGLGLTPDRG